ncbi:MAG: hypothetical protein Q8Q09_09875 [Deltaproteobacteria bacterium]|nr:hypothetical protein [Deltaproteobacteria bacterium]
MTTKPSPKDEPETQSSKRPAKPQPNTWSSGAPSTKEALVSVLGGGVVAMVVIALNVWRFTRIDAGRPASRSFMSRPAVFLVSLVACAGLAVCVPRVFSPVPWMSTRDEWGNWSEGIQLSKARWAALSLGFALINVALFAIGPKFF